MLALIDHLGWEQVAVIGTIPPAMLFAASHPERTRALVLNFTVVLSPPPTILVAAMMRLSLSGR